MREIFALILAAALSVATIAQAGGTGSYCSATGEGAIAATCKPMADNAVVERITFKFASSPTTDENVVVTLDSGSGSDYDVVLLTFDPSAIGGTSIVWVPEGVLSLGPADAITIAYTGTDDVAYGVTVRYAQ